MEAADKLCDELFRWLENRKKCAGKLLELAQKLENVHEGSNTAQVALGAATAVGSITGGVLAIILTGGLATPLVAAATVGTVSYTAVSVTSTLVETFISSSTFKKATELIQEDENVGKNIQKQLQGLKDRCAETKKDRCPEAQLGDHADELDCEMATLLMGALARRSNTPVSLDFLRSFNRATFFRHMTPGRLDQAKATLLICQALCAVSLFSVMTSGLKVSGKVMMKNIGRIGIKTVAKAGRIGIKTVAKAGSAALGVIGLGISQYDLIMMSKDLVKDNRVTEASKILRDSARQILDGRKKLKEQLDAMQEIIQKLLQMKSLIENLGGYSHSMDEKGQRIIDYIRGTCTDSTVLSWLEGLTHQIKFVNLLRFFKKELTETESLTIPEYLKKPSKRHIDIVIVAHGSIVNQFMPASVLVPTCNIKDTILYSPWNCSIDGDAACAIAQGFIHVTNRKLYNNESTPDYEPNPLPDHWNSMRKSHHDIPEIRLSPVTPADEAWAEFKQLQSGVEIGDRLIIPYVLPEDEKEAFGEIPLYMFIFVISFSLMLFNKTATVHLAACLGRLKGSPLRPKDWVTKTWERQKWRRQYAYTNDGTCMTVNLGNTNMNSVLYRALRSMFDTNL